MYMWLNYSDKNNHFKRLPVAVKNISHLFCMPGEKLESDNLHLLLLSDSTRISDNEYLKSLDTTAGLIVCTEEQVCK